MNATSSAKSVPAQAAPSVMGTMSITGVVQDIDPAGFIQVCKIAFGLAAGMPMPHRGDVVSLTASLAHGADVTFWNISTMTVISAANQPHQTNEPVAIPIATQHRPLMSGAAAPASAAGTQGAAKPQAGTAQPKTSAAPSTMPRVFGRPTTADQAAQPTPAPAPSAQVQPRSNVTTGRFGQMPQSAKPTPQAASNTAAGSRFGAISTGSQGHSANQKPPARPAFKVEDMSDDDIPF